MKYQQFLLSFTATALLAAPIAINAEAPPTLAEAEVEVAPAAGEATLVHGLKFYSVVVSRAEATAAVRISASNDSDHRISTEVSAGLMLEPAVTPMSRMVPMPRELAQRTISVRLEPGESFTEVVEFALPADVVADFKRALDEAQDDDANAPVAFAVPPPVVFARVSEVVPSPAPRHARGGNARPVAAN